MDGYDPYVDLNLPKDARSMSFEDLHFLMSEEMHGWTLPEEAK